MSIPRNLGNFADNVDANGQVSLTTGVTGTLPVANGGSGSTTSTGSGANVLATSPALVTPALGTPSALVLTNATGLPAAQLTGTQTLPRSTLPAGAVLQTVQVIKTDTFTTTSGSFVNVTGLSVTITPTSSSSKILLLGSVVGGATVSGCFLSMCFARNSTPIGLGDASGSQFRTMAETNYGTDAGGMFTAGFNYLDSPATASAVTYTIQVSSTDHASTVFINRSQQDNSSTRARGSSTITVMEIAA
jgi:hypothetical protein